MYKIAAFFLLSIVCAIMLNFFSIKISTPKIVSPKKSQINIDIGKYEIKADGYIVYDLDNNEILLEKNSSFTYPTASISKIVSALVAYQYFSKGDEIQITKKDLNVYANTDLKIGDKWDAEELLKFSLIESSNIGITAIQRHVEESTGYDFFDLVKQYQQDKNLNQSYFTNSTGLDIHLGLSSAKSSPKDIVSILKLSIEELSDIIYDTGIYSKKFYTVDNRLFKATNTNILTKKFNNIFISKTGYTDLAGGNLAVVINIKSSKIAIVVLSSTFKERFSDVEKLINIVTDYKKLNDI